MNRILIGTMALILGAATPTFAQSLEDLNIQIHGYATQGFLYTTQNNVFTTNSSDGSAAWTEAVVNISSQPIPKLRVAVQGRYFLLGNFGNAITLDFAMADYKQNDTFGVRFGKVKSPTGLFNEVQDIDPAYIWCLLPQSVYSLTSRNSLLAIYGGLAYGTLDMGSALGKLDYRVYSGMRALASGDGIFIAAAEAGRVLPNGLTGSSNGLTTNWRTPISGLMIGSAYSYTGPRLGVLTYKTFTGTEQRTFLSAPDFYIKYEKKKIMVAGEYVRKPFHTTDTLPGNTPAVTNSTTDQVDWYAMATYKITDKLTVGAYNSQYFNRATAISSSGSRFSKDWVISGRYDFGQFLYAKAEQHFLNGTALAYDTYLNPGGIQPKTKLTILKVGVSF